MYNLLKEPKTKKDFLIQLITKDLIRLRCCHTFYLIIMVVVVIYGLVVVASPFILIILLMKPATYKQPLLILPCMLSFIFTVLAYKIMFNDSQLTRALSKLSGKARIYADEYNRKSEARQLLLASKKRRLSLYEYEVISKYLARINMTPEEMSIKHDWKIVDYRNLTLYSEQDP